MPLEPRIPFIVVWLVFASFYFTVHFRFLKHVRFFKKRAIKVAQGKFDRPTDPGEVTHFQSFTAAMSGTIGLGNIAGVASGNFNRRPWSDALDDN